MKVTSRIAALSSAALLLAGCGGAATSAPAVSTVNPTSPSYSSLQFAVGTANLYGVSTGLNVVSTFRQTSGTSATGVNTPTLSGPITLTALPQPSNPGFPDPYATVFSGGPSLREFGTGSVAGTPQTVTAGTPACDSSSAVPSGFTQCPAGLSPNTSSFGQSGGVFAMGLAPYNAVASTGQAYSYQPYPQPFYGQQDTTSQFQFVPWGGPPAFDPDGTGLGERDGAGSINGVDSFGDPYYLGVGEGITAFDGLTPASGTYTLGAAVSTVGNGGSVSTSTVTKTASLNAGTILPAIASPVFTPDNNGGGSFSLTLPAGVTEAEVQIIDFGPGGGPNDGATSNPLNCQSNRGTAFAPVYYTIVATPGTTAYSLPDTIGPSTATSGGKSNVVPSPSICTATQNSNATSGATTVGDDIVIQVIGFDYPAYEAALGLTKANTPQNPAIVGSAGQADITISQASEQDNGATAAPKPLVRGRNILTHGHPFAPHRIIHR